jgi:hypothetical protein
VQEIRIGEKRKGTTQIAVIYVCAGCRAKAGVKMKVLDRSNNEEGKKRKSQEKIDE